MTSFSSGSKVKVKHSKLSPYEKIQLLSTIQDYVNHLGRSVAIATLLRKVSSLRAFVKFLQISKVIEHEPMNGLHLPRKAEPEPRGLNDNQRARFEAVFQNYWIDKAQAQ